MCKEMQLVAFDVTICGKDRQVERVNISVNNDEWEEIKKCYLLGLEICDCRGLDYLFSQIIDAAKEKAGASTDENSTGCEEGVTYEVKLSEEMESEWEEYKRLPLVNAVYGYFCSLYYTNRRLIMLCGVDAIHDSGQYENELQQLILDIPRLIPYKFNKEKNKIEIVRKDGLLEYADELTFLYDGYERILSTHYDFLDRVRKIRNKLEHIQHGARLTVSSSGTPCGFEFSFLIKEGDKKMRTVLRGNEFIRCITDLNLLFSKIQDAIEAEMFKLEQEESMYYQRLLRYRFSEFSLLYRCAELPSFGKALFPF